MQKLSLFFIVMLVLLPTLIVAEDLCRVNSNNTIASCDSTKKVTINPFIQFAVWAQSNIVMSVFLGLFVVAIVVIFTHWLSQKKNQIFERIFLILMIILALVMLYYLFWG